MDKLAQYRTIVTEVLTELAKVGNTSTSAAEMEDQLLIDPVHDHYQVLTVGWEGAKRVYYPVFHIDIKNGKLWIQEDASDSDLVSILEQRGVTKSDIVLAFHSPSKRAYTGYATA